MYAASWLDRRLTDSEQIGQYRIGKLRFLETGPESHYDSDTKMYEDLASLWKQCSLQLDRICRVKKNAPPTNRNENK